MIGIRAGRRGGACGDGFGPPRLFTGRWFARLSDLPNRAIAGIALVCLPAASPAACYDDEIGTPLSVELIGPETGVVDQKLSVLYNASGRRLIGIIFTWGDGTVDSLAAAGAQTASGAREHTYEAAGLFTVRARAEDSVEGVASAEVMIDIQQNQ